MSVRGPSLIVCDACGQMLIVPLLGSDRPDLVRGYAKEMYWTTADRDLCPIHSKEPAHSA